ncbi:hypothetical protein [Subtercola vilae]|uniref:Uncharacterized protein n=1 Tax=Subtercola vilae TaxID=2056433 RepID=A0A4V4RG98_9MICO|nr:hypothetical protein [Subtercola vilae]TIH36144.1 hypothetical protein D4765_10180 [Subtercola vilae]
MVDAFDDPEVKRLMAELGVVHRPGLAAELMEEIGPLLAEDGFDVNNLEAPDLDTLNAAIGRAVERRNFERFVPVDNSRQQALRILRLVAEAIGDGNTPAARTLIAGLEPEPAGDKPSIAHVIGVSLGLLDTWHTTPALHATLRGTRVPVWDKPARTAAADVLALAGKGRAFDSISGLHRRHTGLMILTGGILAVAGTLQAWATHERTTVRELTRAVLPDSTSTQDAAPAEQGSPAQSVVPNRVLTIPEELESMMRPDALASFRSQVRQAHLDEPVTVSITAKARFVLPYQWLLDQVGGGGIRLTAAGYLPPAVVASAMEELGWQKDWVGKGNREDLTMPVLYHRESMMAMKLLHRRKGVLLPTPVGRRLTGDPAGLWNFLARSMLVRPTEVEARATEFFLLAVAARSSQSHNEYSAAVAAGLYSIGWADPSGRQIRPDQAFTLFADTWRTLRRLGAFEDDREYGVRGTVKPVGAAFARYTLTQPPKP